MVKVSIDDIAQVEKLNGPENFQVWKFQITIMLRANDLLGIVQEEPQDTVMWKKKDANAQRIIVLLLDKKPLMHILNCNTAREMWTKLSNVYQRENE